MQLTKVTVSFPHYFHIFKMNDGSEVKVETTEQDYKQLGAENPQNPTMDNGVWVSSYCGNKYGTPSGELEDGMYCDFGDSYLVKLPNKELAQVSKDKIVNNELL